jgi:hypothetical protein
MIIDALGSVATSQAIPTNATSGFSEDVLDLSAAVTSDQVGSGEQITILFTVENTPVASDTYQFQLVGDANADLSGTNVVLSETSAMASADLPAGTQFSISFPAKAYKTGARYVGVKWVTNDNAATLTFSAHMVMGVQTN